MKTKYYKYVVIDKNNMKTLKHFSTKERVVDEVINGKLDVIIKNETEIIDLSLVREAFLKGVLYGMGALRNSL